MNNFLKPGSAFFSYDVPLFRGKQTNVGHVFLVVYATDTEIGLVDVTTSKRRTDLTYYVKQRSLPHNIELAQFDRECKPFNKEVFIETSTFRAVKRDALLQLRIWELNGHNGEMAANVLEYIREDVERCCASSYRGLSSEDLCYFEG